MPIRKALPTSMPVVTQASGAPIPIEVFKTPTCGRCSKWVAHLKAKGFEPKVTDVASTAAYWKRFDENGAVTEFQKYGGQ